MAKSVEEQLRQLRSHVKDELDLFRQELRDETQQRLDSFQTRFGHLTIDHASPPTLSNLQSTPTDDEPPIRGAAALMKVRGEINGSEVIVLAVSGAIYNFISSSKAKQLGLPVTRARKGYSVCKAITLGMQGVTVCDDLCPIELGPGTDVILGFPWLDTLGKYCLDFGKLEMSFKVGGKTTITLRADPRLTDPTEILAPSLYQPVSYVR